jgi:hypothetical protein
MWPLLGWVSSMSVAIKFDHLNSNVKCVERECVL